MAYWQSERMVKLGGGSGMWVLGVLEMQAASHLERALGPF